MKQKDSIKKIIMYKTEGCGDCKRAEIFFDKYNIDYKAVDIDFDKDAENLVVEINGGNRSVPTIIVKYFEDTDQILIEPTFEDLESEILE